MGIEHGARGSEAGSDGMAGASGGMACAEERSVEEGLRFAQLKSEFVSKLSHELRTPLTSIRGALELMTGGVVGELSRDAEVLLGIASHNVERLTRLIDDLLDVAKLEAGRLKVARLPLDVAAVATRAILASSSLAATRAVTMRRRGSGSAWALGDEERLLQVLRNLLSNAIHFSPERGSVEVDVTTSCDKVRVSVQDEGPGVPAAFAGRLFETFAQEDGSDHRVHSGAGLGLAISRSLVELLGGTITYERGAAGGALFRVELEAARQTRP